MCDDAAVPESILEVIALNAVDARAARAGGADRIELVTDMRRQGLTPDLATFVSVREAVDIPVRVMLRSQDGYALSNAEALVEAATALRTAGAGRSRGAAGRSTGRWTIRLTAAPLAGPSRGFLGWTPC
jgi:copper homeostasis protein